MLAYIVHMALVSLGLRIAHVRNNLRQNCAQEPPSLEPNTNGPKWEPPTQNCKNMAGIHDKDTRTLVGMFFDVTTVFLGFPT